MASSKYIVDSASPWKGAGQTGPDGKIYIPEEGTPKLSVINYPDLYGPACNISPNAIDLAGRNAMRALPYFYSGAISNKSVDFTYIVNTDCKTVTFTGSSIIPGPVNWEWNFGDGTKASGQTVTHAFSDIGDNFNVLLTAVNPGICGGKGRKMKNIRFNRVAPKAEIIMPDSCGSKTASFRDGSSIISGRVINWLWDFGDGTTSTQQNPVHTYNSYGAYQVKLIATADDGCQTKDIITKNFSIKPKPQADFKLDKACAGETIHFSDLSSIDENTINNWQWKFGDGSIIQLQHPEKLFSTAENQIVDLVVKSTEGCSDTITKTISVSSKPIANFTLTGICVGSPSKFSDLSTVANNQIATWYWKDGNGQTYTIQSPEITYIQARDYDIEFAVSSASGCISDTVRRTVTIGSKPIADFEFANSCGEKTANFTDKSVNNNQPLVKWFWNFGDSKSSNTQNVLHTYSAFSSYTVSFAATSSMGCSSDTVKKIVDVRAKPEADFTFNDGCVNSLIAFTDASTLISGIIKQWKWLINNNTAIEQKDIQQQFPAFGNYPIRLIITSDKDCSDTVIKTVSIEPKPVADFSIDNGCEGLALKPTNNSTIEFGSIVKHYWDFGDGNTASIDKPSYSYPVYGNYMVKHTVVSKNGCVADTIQKEINIESIPEIAFQFGNTCAGKEIRFTNLSSNEFGAITKWKWSLGNADNSNLFEPAYTYQKYGNYSVSLSATTANGCTAHEKKTINIAKVIVSAGNDTIASVGQPLQLNANGAKDYEWQPGTRLNNAATSNPVALLNNDQTYILKGTTAEGCIGYDTLNIKVFKLADIFVPTAFTPNGDGKNDFLYPICAGIKTLEHFTVFNRWGEVVFTTKKMGDKWNGIFKSSVPGTTTFVWMVKGISYDGRIIERKGTTTLIK
jgi:gliding motility-associated-like protein